VDNIFRNDQAAVHSMGGSDTWLAITLSLSGTADEAMGLCNSWD
jgi:hypothetical protein